MIAKFGEGPNRFQHDLNAAWYVRAKVNHAFFPRFLTGVLGGCRLRCTVSEEQRPIQDKSSMNSTAQHLCGEILGWQLRSLSLGARH